MSNDVALFKQAGISLAAIGKFAKSIDRVQMEAPQVGGDKLLRLGKDGIWKYGQELMEVEPGSLWAVDPSSFAKGFSAFVGQKPKEVLRNVMKYEDEGPIDKNMLPDLGDDAKGNRIEWKSAIQVCFQCMNGEDKGIRVRYAVNNGGGVERWHDLLAQVGHQAKIHPNMPVAIVSFEHDGYFHSDPSFGVRKDGKPGWVVKPVFKIVDWMALDGSKDTEQEDVEADEPAPEQTASTGRRASTLTDNGAAPAASASTRRQSTIIEATGTASGADVGGAGQAGASPDPVVRRRRRVAS
jgi:hypothetical protein